MNPLRPAVAQFLLKSAPGKLQPWLVEESAELVGPGCPDKHGCRIRYQQKPSFAFLCPGFGLLPRCDVQRDPTHSDRLTFPIKLNASARGHPAYLPGGQNSAMDLIVIGTSA